MGKTIGVVSRFPEHLADFELAYYEVKDVSGIWHDPVVGAVPMVSVFGDNRLRESHPEWVQVGPNAERAERTLSYFDWDAICPSHPGVRQAALAWIRKAVRLSGMDRLRLDDANFAREGFCHCAVCEREKAATEMFDDYRLRRITAFVEEVRTIVPNIDMTLFPDPLPGHLEHRFGVDVERLSSVVDRFVIPIYDLHYATTYWLEVLAQGFQERLSRPFLVELYALGVDEKALSHAAEVALHYADGVIFAYGNNREMLGRIIGRLGRAV